MSLYCGTGRVALALARGILCRYLDVNSDRAEHVDDAKSGTEIMSACNPMQLKKRADKPKSQSSGDSNDSEVDK